MGYDFVEDMAIDKKGSVYLTGRSTGASYDIATVKFSEIITNISSNNIPPPEYKLEQNYPNPFNPTTKFIYELPNTNYVTLKVYDVLGNEVATLVNEKQNSGSYEVNFDAGEYGLSSGMYFYTLLSGNFSMTKKMILIK